MKKSKGVIINYFVVFAASWAILLLISMLQNTKASFSDILFSDGFILGEVVYSISAVFLTAIIYLWSLFSKNLVMNRKLLFMIAFVAQFVPSLEFLGVKYNIFFSLGHPYVNLLAFYFVIVGIIALFNRLFFAKI